MRLWKAGVVDWGGWQRSSPSSLHSEPLAVRKDEQAAASKMASFSFQNLLQRPHCREQQPDGRPAATPLAAHAHATPPGSLRSGQWRSYEWHDLLRPGSRHSHRAWKTGKTVGGGGGERVLEALGRWLLHPFQPPSFPGVAEPQRSQLARGYGGLPLPCGSMRHSCLVTDALERRFMTSLHRPTNGKGSRGEAFHPFRLGLFTRVSERVRAEGVGELSGRVARMSGEAPPPRLYIKGWRGARRRHFALEWSSL